MNKRTRFRRKLRHHKYWFKQKTFGYGATPKTWEVWFLVLVFVLFVLALPLIISPNTTTFFIILGILVALIIFISYAKTEGGWHWRWG